MKLSVSIPDELWDRARARCVDPSPSAVVQQALREFTADRVDDRPSYAVPPVATEDMNHQLELLRERLLSEAQERFGFGYRQGIDLAGQLDWVPLAWIARAGIRQAAKAMVDFTHQQQERPESLPANARHMIPCSTLIPYAGSVADPEGIDTRDLDELIEEGIDAALKDIYGSIRGHHRAAPGSRAAGSGVS